ncbi:MAG: hypothetical protein ABH857_05615, partial [Elusimicrobiota bacterium]
MFKIKERVLVCTLTLTALLLLSQQIFATYIPKPDAIDTGDTSVDTVDTGDGYVDVVEDGTSVIRVTGDNVGIGTTEPSEKLDVIGDIKSSATVQAPIGDFDTIYVSSIVGSSPVYFQNDIDLGGKGISALGSLDVTYGITAATAVYSGAVSADKINTGYGDYELYAMDQDLETGDSVTFATLDTGQGANELYDMNQNVQTTDSPTFAEVITSSVSARNSGGLYLVDDGNNGIFIKDGGNVGIGSTNPLSKLDVIVANGGEARIQTANYASIGESAFLNFQGRGIIGYSSSTAMGLSALEMRTPSKHILINTNDTILDNYIFINGTSSDYIKFGTLGTERVMISSAGYVGIGSTIPVTKLDLGTDLKNTKLALYGGGTAWYGIGVQSNQFRLHVGNSEGRFSFLDAPAGNELLTIKGTGNVGIGTTTPTEKLHINGNVKIAGTPPNTSLTISSNLSTGGKLITALDPIMADGDAVRYDLGQSQTTYNCVENSFVMVSSGATSNYYQVGLYGKSIASFVGTGRVGIGE